MHGLRQTAVERFNLQADGGVINHGRPQAELVWLVDWKAIGKPYCSIYVISPEGKWPSKIGISTAPVKRVATLQTAVWKPLSVNHSLWCNTVKDAKAIETMMHEHLDTEGRWLHGEWFDMRPDKALELIQFKAMIAGIECNSSVEDDDALAMIESRTTWTYDQVKKRIDRQHYSAFVQE